MKQINTTDVVSVTQMLTGWEVTGWTPEGEPFELVRCATHSRATEAADRIGELVRLWAEGE